jgi:DNA mismatch repair protein MutH
LENPSSGMAIFKERGKILSIAKNKAGYTFCLVALLFGNTLKKIKQKGWLGLLTLTMDAR